MDSGRTHVALQGLKDRLDTHESLHTTHHSTNKSLLEDIKANTANIRREIKYFTLDRE